MNQGTDTRLSTRPSDAAETEAPGRLQELPNAPPDTPKDAVSAALPEPLRPPAAAAAGWEMIWQLLAWFEDRRLSSLRQAVPAVVVGCALAVQKGAGFAWHIPVLALAGIVILLMNGMILESVVGRIIGARNPVPSPDPEAGEKTEETDEPTGDAENSKPAPPRRESRRGLGFAIAAVACLATLGLAGGWFVPVLYVFAVVFSIGLSDRYIPVAWRSQSESVARIGLTTVVVGVVYLAQGGAWTIDAVVAGLQLGLLATVLTALHSLRDLGLDLKTGRKTIVSRFGVPVGQYHLALLCLFPFTMNMCWLFASAWGAALLPLLALPLALWVIRDVNQNIPGPILNLIRPRVAGLHLAFALLLAIGLLI